MAASGRRSPGRPPSVSAGRDWAGASDAEAVEDEVGAETDDEKLSVILFWKRRENVSAGTNSRKRGTPSAS